MKTGFIYFAGLTVLMSTSAIAQHRSITFEHGSFAEIKAKALKENKLIFIDAFTTWCGPCKQMAKNVFTNDTVADYFNTNLVNAKIDMEKGEGLEIAKQYKVQCYPNLLFIDGNGNLVHRIAGSMSSSAFIAEANTAKNPEKRFSYYETNYDKNKQNSEFLVKYITAMSSTCLEPGDAITQYFSLQKESDLTSNQNWEMIKEHINSIEDKEFIYLVSHKKEFDNLYTEKEVDNKINKVNQNTLISVIRKKPFDQKIYDEKKSKISAMNLSGTKQVFFETDMFLAQKTGDLATYTKLAVENVDLYYSNDPNKLNSIAWDFYEKVADKDALIKAESWAKKASEIEGSYPPLDTYAALLYKNGKKQLALETANKAIEAAKKEEYPKEDYQGTIDLLKKIKEMK